MHNTKRKNILKNARTFTLIIAMFFLVWYNEKLRIDKMTLFTIFN